VGYVYVMYYFTIITPVIMPRDDLGETNQPGRKSNLEHFLLLQLLPNIHEFWIKL
jgi:hypothetical protein